MKDDENPLEDELLRALKPADAPRDEVEAKVVAALKREGLIRGSRKTSVWRYAIAAVLILSLFAAGFWAGRYLQPAQPGQDHRPLFALFLYEQQGRFVNAPGQVQEYSAWIRNLRGPGRLAGGEKLKENGRTLQLEQGRLQVEERPLHIRELRISGYFLVQAASYEEALQIAATCPHLKYGGVIEIRQIEPA